MILSLKEWAAWTAAFFIVLGAVVTGLQSAPQPVANEGYGVTIAQAALAPPPPAPTVSAEASAAVAELVRAVHADLDDPPPQAQPLLKVPLPRSAPQACACAPPHHNHHHVKRHHHDVGSGQMVRSTRYLQVRQASDRDTPWPWQ